MGYEEGDEPRPAKQATTGILKTPSTIRIFNNDYFSTSPVHEPEPLYEEDDCVEEWHFSPALTKQIVKKKSQDFFTSPVHEPEPLYEEVDEPQPAKEARTGTLNHDYGSKFERKSRVTFAERTEQKLYYPDTG